MCGEVWKPICFCSIVNKKGVGFSDLTKPPKGASLSCPPRGFGTAVILSESCWGCKLTALTLWRHERSCPLTPQLHPRIQKTSSNFNPTNNAAMEIFKSVSTPPSRIGGCKCHPQYLFFNCPEQKDPTGFFPSPQIHSIFWMVKPTG